LGGRGQRGGESDAVWRGFRKKELSRGERVARALLPGKGEKGGRSPDAERHRLHRPQKKEEKGKKRFPFTKGLTGVEETERRWFL